MPVTLRAIGSMHLPGQPHPNHHISAPPSRCARLLRPGTGRWRDRRAAAAIEFAVVAVPFFVIVFFVLALCLHFYYQELLDIGLHGALRKVQTGGAQNVADGNTFVASYLCPAMGNLVTCGDLYIQVRKVDFAPGQDYYNVTTGNLPTADGALDLSGFGSAKFCNAGPSQFVLATAIYVAPTVIGWLLPNVFSVSFNGSQVDAIMSQVMTFTEDYTAQKPAGAPTPSC
jgi:Flp pilus assembly protein TadG